MWAALGVLALLATLLTPLSSASAQTVAPPDAPGFVSATPGSGLTSTAEVTLRWSPGADNGSTVIRWEYKQDVPDRGLWIPIEGSNHLTNSYTVTGLSYGTEYTFSVRAVNSIGTGATRASNAVIPTTIPEKPQFVSVTAVQNTGVTTVALLLRTHYTDDDGTASEALASKAGGFVRSLPRPQDRFVTAQYRYRAVGQDWTPWAAIDSRDPVDNVPDGAPRVPVSEGSSLYVATAPGLVDTAITQEIAGLSYGVAYLFETRYVNVNGPGPAAIADNLKVRDSDGNIVVDEDRNPIPAAYLVATTPGRPRSLTAVPGNGQVTLSWEAPDDGGRPITDWQYRVAEADSNSDADFTDVDWNEVPLASVQAMSHTVSQLDNAKQYKFQVRAVNGIGPGESAETEVVNPGAVPNPPTDLQGVAGEDNVTLTWLPPLKRNQDGEVIPPAEVADGGSPIIRYEYSVRAGDGDYGGWVPILSNALYRYEEDRTLTNPDGGGSAITPQEIVEETGAMGTVVHNLTPGTAYYFRVRAVNSTGGSYPARWSGIPVYPGTPPLSPAGLTATPVYDADSGHAQIRLSWNSGGNGGSPITSWEYLYANSQEDLNTLLANGADWSSICTLTFRNPQNDLPDPAFDTGCTGATQVTVPRINRLGYSISYDDMGIINLFSDDPANTMLATHDHFFVIRAHNAHGPGFTSSMVNTRFTPTAPAAPSGGVFVVGSDVGARTMSLTWRPAVDGGSPIVRYEYSAKVGNEEWSPWAPTTESTNHTHAVPAIVPAGTPHQFRVRAVNTLGGRFVPGAVAESPVTLFGAPGMPGAMGDLVAEFNAPVLNASNTFGDVTGIDLQILEETGGTRATTRWEYSYKVGDGEYSEWTFQNFGEQFNNGDDFTLTGLEPGAPHSFRVRALNGPLASTVIETNPRWSGVSGLFGPLTPTVLEGYPRTPATPGSAPPAAIGLTAAAVDDDPGEALLVTPGNPSLPNYLQSFYAITLPGDGVARLTWSTASHQGPPITSWEYRFSPNQNFGQLWTPIPGSGPDTTEAVVTYWPSSALLDSGPTGYTFQVRARSDAGAGQIAQSNRIVPGSTPSVPPAVYVTPGDNQAIVKVDVPFPIRDDGGRVVTGYQVRKSQDGGAYDAWTALGNSRPPQTPVIPLAAESGVAVRGLINGASYTFQVRAVNEFGIGGHITSSAVVPRGAATVFVVSASAGNGEVSLSWDPANTAGSAITTWQYRVAMGDEGFGSWTGIAGSGPATTSHTVSGLSNGVSYTFEVRALNASGPSTPISSDAVTPSALPPAPSVTAERGDGMVQLSWDAGDYGEVGDADFASAATDWQLQVDGGDWNSLGGFGVPAAARSIPVPNLNNGQEYSFALRAVNAQGAGEAGMASATPAAAPAAPEVTAIAGVAATVVSWVAGDDGGSAVTGWEFQVDGGAWTDLSTYGLGADAREVQVPASQLDPAMAHTFGVRGVNDVGAGAAGTATTAAADVPSAPTVTAVGGDGEITVTWSAGEDGGAPVTGWHYRVKVSVADYGDWMETSGTSVTLTGLDSGTGALAYTVQVRAVNGVGEGAAGTSNEATPVEVADADGAFYSGVIDSAEFCTNFSLGGARLFAHDSDGDGVADVCSLPYTRREAVARQIAVDELAIQYAGEFAALVNAACAVTDPVADDGGNNACGGQSLAEPPAVPISDGGPFYSGIITGSSFCANFSLGGPVTYPHDSDGDGVADVCALPYTRREAIARQLAGDILAATYTADFDREVARACRSLSAADYGDNPADLAEDICS